MAFTKPQPGSDGRRTQPSEALVETLANKRRRTVLEVLERLSPTPREELATHVAAVEADAELSEVSHDAARRVQRTLHHRHLPQLEDAGLVRCPDDVVVAIDSAPVEVWEFVTDIDADELDWDDAARALGNSRCRAVVAALVDVDAPADRERVAATAADRHTDDTTRSEDIDRMDRHIHHVTLPKLDDCGLLSYDHRTGTVAHGGQDESVFRLLDALVR